MKPPSATRRARFESMLRDPDDHTFEESVAAGRRFIESLTQRDLAVCRYHQADWAAIARASAEIFEKIDRRIPNAYLTAAEAVNLPQRDKRWLESLFHNPIDVGDDRKSYTNGQHRGCALRFSGAQKAAVVVGFEHVLDDFADWTYIGDG